jgi:radical SAM superfamily enzyme YgiQ (UPF0313 family)
MNVLFVQLPVPVFAPIENTGNHPLAAASLILHYSYANNNKSHNLTIIDQQIAARAGDLQIIDTIVLESPDIIAFTCTVWNIERTIYIAEKLRAQLPHCQLWAGGPEISQDSWFISPDRCIFDIAVPGEGEVVFKFLLDHFQDAPIPGVFYNGKMIQSGNTLQLKNLDSIHDPFISSLVSLELDNVMVCEFSRGCKYRCSFCRYHCESDKHRFVKRSDADVELLFIWARNNGVREIFLLDPSLEQRRDSKSFLEFLASVNTTAIPVFAELRAEFVTQDYAHILYKAGIRLVETGLQSVTQQVLRNVRRTLNPDKFADGIKNLRNANIGIRTDIMAGLPGETEQSFTNTIQFIKRLQLENAVQVFCTQVLPGTELRKQASKFGIEYETRPPYNVLSTYNWRDFNFATIINRIEDELEISVYPESRPVFYISDPHDNKRFIPQTRSVYAYFFDCTIDNYRNTLMAENFREASNTVSICYKVNKIESIGHIVSSVQLFIESNPFTSVQILFAVPGGFPLDLVDKTLSIMHSHRYSSYMKNLHPTMPDTGERSVFIVPVITPEHQFISKSWFEAIREVSTIVWCYESFEIYQKYCNAQFYAGDLLQLQAPPEEQKESLFAVLKDLEYNDCVCFSDLQTHWDYLRFTS